MLLEDANADVVTARRMLRRLAPSAELEHVPTSEALVEMLDGRSDGSWWPTLFILDVNLPGRSGITTLRWLKNHPWWRRVPVVVLSGSANATEVQECYDLGAASYLTKPIGADQLNATWSAIVQYWGHQAAPTTPPGRSDLSDPA